MTTTTATARPPLSATIPPGVRMTEPDGGPRLFFHVQTCEFLTVDELGYVPAELYAEMVDATLEAAAAYSRLAADMQLAGDALEALRLVLQRDRDRWLALPRHSRVAATRRWRRARRRQRRVTAAAMRSRP